MEKEKRDFIIDELMEPRIIEKKQQEMILEEKEETGRSILKVSLKSGDNLCIANVDKKKTDMLFFQQGGLKSLQKRVDHIIFERQADDKWTLHLIEMKGSVRPGKWAEVKGKFRASYLLSQALAGILEIEISNTIMYTTFEKVQFISPDTMPSARRTGTGNRLIRMEEEWSGKCFGLNFGKQVPFLHRPIQMKRNEQEILEGLISI